MRGDGIDEKKHEVLANGSIIYYYAHPSLVNKANICLALCMIRGWLGWKFTMVESNRGLVIHCIERKYLFDIIHYTYESMINYFWYPLTLLWHSLLSLSCSSSFLVNLVIIWTYQLVGFDKQFSSDNITQCELIV